MRGSVRAVRVSGGRTLAVRDAGACLMAVPRTAWRKASGEVPVRWWKNLLKFVALEKPRRAAIFAAGWSPCARSRFASSSTRRSMYSFAPTPAASLLARESVRVE
jgi:hypothetical protein